MNGFSVLCILFTITITACGGGDGPDLEARDPRCVAACPETMPKYDGVGGVCDTASRVQCLDECEARIAGLPTQCQNCLVEDSYFSPGGRVVDGGSCTDATCTLTTDFGTCSYPLNDHAAELLCLKKVDPRREVSCEASFKSATKCATVCPTM